MMKSKLPRSILEDIEQMKDDEEEWTVKSFRKRLNKKINALEAADLQISLYKKTDESTILTSSYRLAEDSSHSTELSQNRDAYFVKEGIGVMSAEDILTLLLEKKKSKIVVISAYERITEPKSASYQNDLVFTVETKANIIEVCVQQNLVSQIKNIKI